MVSGQSIASPATDATIVFGKDDACTVDLSQPSFMLHFFLFEADTCALPSASPSCGACPHAEVDALANVADNAAREVCVHVCSADIVNSAERVVDCVDGLW